MTMWRRSMLGVTALARAGCSTTPKVFSDFDPEQSFDSYQTFSWISDNPMTVAGDRGPNPIVAARLKAAIQEEFERKGFEFVAKPADADIVVAWTVGARRSSKATTARRFAMPSSAFSKGFRLALLRSD